METAEKDNRHHQEFDEHLKKIVQKNAMLQVCIVNVLKKKIIIRPNTYRSCIPIISYLVDLKELM